MVFLPVSIIIFLNKFGVTKVDSLLGINILLIASIGLLLIQIGDIIDSHLKGSQIIMMWTAAVILCIPGIIFLLSKAIKLSGPVAESLPLIIACFLFTEGISSFFIGD